MAGMTPLVRNALALCIRLHDEMQDIHGLPYATHPIAVAARLADEDERCVAAALLHDVVEDCGIAADDLVCEGIPSDVAATVLTLSRRDTETYAEYIERISRDEIARKVKMADLRDNLDSRRGPFPSAQLAERYRKALVTLSKQQGTTGL